MVWKVHIISMGYIDRVNIIFQVRFNTFQGEVTNVLDTFQSRYPVLSIYFEVVVTLNGKVDSWVSDLKGHTFTAFSGNNTLRQQRYIVTMVKYFS